MGSDQLVKTLLLIVLITIPLPTFAVDCKGHIFFYIFEDDSESEDAADANSDYVYYYLKVKKWLPDAGVSFSIHTEIPIKAMTCFGKKEEVEKEETLYSLGYVLVRTDSERKVYGGVMTDVDIDNIINDFFVAKTP